MSNNQNKKLNFKTPKKLNFKTPTIQETTKPEPETTVAITIDELPSSDLIGATIHGLDAPDEPEEGKFVYINCLNRPYDNKKHQIKSITFDIDRYSEFQHTIEYQFPVTEENAIRDAEKFLSQPLTPEYYKKIQDDTFHESDWDEVKQWMICRGDCLSDKKFLEGSDLDEETYNLTIWCGS